MQAEAKTAWLEALRSGKYTQGRAYLKTEEGFCCLGVLCDISELGTWTLSDVEGENGAITRRYFYNVDGESMAGMPPFPVSNTFGLESFKERDLAGMNDNGASFTEIADWIEKNV